MTLRRTLWVAALAAALACPGARASDPVTIAAVLSESPPAAGITARLIRAGMEAAIAVSNAEEAGRRQPVRLVVRDDGGMPDKSAEAVARAAAEDKAVAVLGGQTSPTGLAQVTAAARAGRPLVNVNGWDRGLRMAGVADVFHIGPDPDTLPEAIAHAAAAVGGGRIALVLPAGERSAVERADALRDWIARVRPGTAVRTATIDLAQRGPFPAVASFTREPADLVIAVAGPFFGGRLIAPLRAANVAPSLTTLLMDGGGIADGLPAREDLRDPTRLMLSVALHHPDIPVTARGREARRRLPDDMPETRLFHQGADAVFAIVDALRRARGTDATALVRALDAAAGEGTRGPIAFLAEPGPRFRQRRDLPFALVQHVDPAAPLAEAKIVWRPGTPFEAGAVTRSARPTGAKR